MTYEVPSRYEEFTLLIKVATVRPEKIRVIVKDADMKNTVFTDRYKTVDGESSFFVRMPITGKTLFASIYNERIGNVEADADDSFKVLQIKRLPLEKKTDVVDFNDAQLKTFIRFCTRFCFNAGELTSGTYKSSDGKFVIEYLPTIINAKGREMATPARISVETGLIQVSQSKFVGMTVPMRMAILLHEYSHYYVNDVMSDEIEADLNGLLVYLGLGYPRIEAYEAFLKTFIGTPSEQNKVRYDKINRFINEFEKHNFIVYE